MNLSPHNGILITGGSGFLGRGLVQRLLREDVERICIYSRNEYAQARMSLDFRNDQRLRFFIGDVRDLTRLERAMESVECVIHAAALKRIEVGAYNPDEMLKTNVMGTMNVIEAARRAGVDRVLFVSTDKAFEPVSPYGMTKALAEYLVLSAQIPEYGPRFAVTRYGNVAGSTGSVIPMWREALRCNNSAAAVPVTDPDCTRFYMTRDQAVDLVLRTLENMRGGELIVPKLPAYRLGDLATAMGARAIEIKGLGKWEKKHESMEAGSPSDLAPRLSVEALEKLLEAIPA